MVKKRYDGNEILGLAWDRMELCRMPLFITTAATKNCQANLSKIYNYNMFSIHF